MKRVSQFIWLSEHKVLAICQAGRERKSWSLISLVLGALLLMMPHTGKAEGDLSGRYLPSDGRELVLRIDIGEPPPASLILIQQIPPGIAPLSATPPYKKADLVTGELKWLLKLPAAGSHEIRVHFAEELPSGSVRAILRCKDPTTGEFMTVTIP
jgi:hypothetical protein